MSSADLQSYVFGNADSEQQRLLSQAQSFAPQARWLLDQIGVGPGWRALDLGCGPLGILDLLSERVGADGRVVGLEREARFAQAARDELTRRGLRNVSVLQADGCCSGLLPGSFDFAHERLVMINIARPADVLANLIGLVRPGGHVAVEEVDAACWLCQPPHPSWDKLFATFSAVLCAAGGDVFFGRKLPALLRQAGLRNVACKLHAGLAEPQSYRRRHLLALVESLREPAISLGLLTDAELAHHQQALAIHLEDRNTIVIDQLLVQAWGQKSA